MTDGSDRRGPLVDVTGLDLDAPRWPLDGVRALLPHRFEFEQLSGILDVGDGFVVGFKRYAEDEAAFFSDFAAAFAKLSECGARLKPINGVKILDMAWVKEVSNGD